MKLTQLFWSSARSFAPALASAQELGTKGDAIFSVDRRWASPDTHSWRAHARPRAVPRRLDRRSASLAGLARRFAFDMPRFAFDYLSSSIWHRRLARTTFRFDAQRRAGHFDVRDSPRVGYLYSFGRVVGIWPRGGFTYHSTSVNNGPDENGLALTLECPFTFSPPSHFAFTLGPASISTCSARAIHASTIRTRATGLTGRSVSAPGLLAGCKPRRWRCSRPPAACSTICGRYV